MKAARMGLRPHYLFDLIAGGGCLLTLLVYWFWAGTIADPRRRKWVRIAISAAVLIVTAGVALSPVRINRLLANDLVQWVRCAAIFIAIWVLYSVPVMAVVRLSGAHVPGRRTFIRGAAAAAVAAPPLLATAAFLSREALTFREVELRISGLPASLDGLRLVQVSDIHLSPFVSESLLARAVDMANETRAHIALVTGDLVSRRGDPLDNCLLQLKRLRSDAGTYGCLGNHEIYAGAEDYTTRQGAKLGMQFLRGQSRLLHFGDAALNLAGVDYQRRGTRYLVGAERLLRPDAINILLSHNPDVFPIAADKGFDVTIAGHTHGGQVNFEILERGVNIARFFTPYVYGRYEREGKSLFVTRGIGTVGAPARLGAPPEVALIRLCAS